MPKTKPSGVIVAYVPVLHRGYLDFFAAYPNVQDVYILDQKMLDKIDYLRKELRALTPAQQLKAVKGLDRFQSVKLLTQAAIAKLDTKDSKIVFPDEDISHEVAQLFKKATVSFYPVFLRWDRRSINKENTVTSDRTISTDQFDTEFIKLANTASTKSSNIWRRVGAVIVKKGSVIAAGSNKHLPTEHSLWIDGDPRSTLKKGIGLEVTTDMHAEALLIASAAKDGTSLKGASIYVTNFPCPPCSKLIAAAGISKCYYSGGYAVLDGENILKAYGVEIIHVDEPESEGHPASWVPYKKSKN